MTKVVVLGAGNAGLCAALAAREAGAAVTVLEAAEEDAYGSDSYFSGGLFRVAYDNLTQIEEIVGPMGLEGAQGLEDFQSYSEGDFLDDWGRLTGYRTDPELSSMIVADGLAALKWLSDQGVTFQAPLVIDGQGRLRHTRPGWHGGFLEAAGAGPGLTESLLAAVRREGVAIRYGSRVLDFDRQQDGQWQVRCHASGDQVAAIEGDAVIIATGGFQSDAEWRTRALGPGWDLAKVRGSVHNTGGGLRAALALGAASHGNWSGCHAVAWSVGSASAGRRDANHIFERESFPFGITVNVHGERFVDEGNDFGAYTYAKYGKEILRQPEQVAWQLFDAQAEDLKTSEYRSKNPEAARVQADSMADLCATLASRRGVDARRMLATVEAYNAAIGEQTPFSPYVLDGRGTMGLPIEKTNWARALTVPPFEAYEVTCGITFTFGGLRIDTSARVLGNAGQPLPGLYACGEAVGGLHYFNYASGTGLTSGSVLGRIAGRIATTGTAA